MNTREREREREQDLSPSANNKQFKVVYAKLGKRVTDNFSTLDEAIQDYEIKLSIDKNQYFDDRFVIGVEDENGNTVYPKKISNDTGGI